MHFTKFFMSQLRGSVVVGPAGGAQREGDDFWGETPGGVGPHSCAPLRDDLDFWVNQAGSGATLMQILNYLPSRNYSDKGNDCNR